MRLGPRTRILWKESRAAARESAGTLPDSVAEDFADKMLFPVGGDPDVFPVESVGGDIGENPVGALLPC